MRKKKNDLSEANSQNKYDALPNQQLIKNINILQEPEIKFASKPSVAFEHLKIKSEFSLNDLKKIPTSVTSTEENNLIATPLKVSNKEITFEDVKKTISEYAQLKEKSGAKLLSINLTSAQLTFINNTIKLAVTNETQREQLQNSKQIFLDEIRSKLQNNTISLEIELVQTQTETKAFKPKDIFKVMAEKNPALLELKKRFDLEVEY